MASLELPVVVYDACVLYPFHLRNVLVQCAVDRLVDARWTDDIHGEWIRNLLKNDPVLTRDRLERTRDLMKAVLPEADVTGYGHLIPGLTLKDPDDRHVLAAAVHAKADTILSADRGFTDAVLRPYGLRAQRPDGFLTGLLEADREPMLDSLARARRNLRKSTPGPEAFVEGLRACRRLDGFCAALSMHMDRL